MTTLAEIRDGAATGVDLMAMRVRRTLVTEIQRRLGELGLLDPPADGDFGPVSLWAWRSFCDQHGVEDFSRVTPELARLLLSHTPDSLYPLDAQGGDFASRVVRSMQAQGYWIARHPDCVNIAYVEGHDPEGNANDNRTDGYNDVRMTFCIRDGRAEILGAWTATTQPGWHWVLNPAKAEIRDPVKAAAQIALGQFKAWCIGTHTGGSISHEALVQRAPIRVYRDRNKDGRREGDPVFERPDYGINQHHGSNSTKVGRYSAGCLVANSAQGHREFLRLLKQDRRYVASNAFRFMTAVLGASQLQA